MERFAFELFVKEAVEDHAGGKSSDEGSESRPIGEPRQLKRKNRTK